MGKIKVYFTNGNTGVFDRDKVMFKERHGECFSFGREDDVTYGDSQAYAAVLDYGPVVNWDAVSWVRAYKEEEDNA